MKTAEQVILELQTSNIKLWVEGGKLRYRAPQNALTDLLRAEIAQYRTEILTLLNQGTTQTETRQTIHPAPRTQPLPLSYAQQRLWFLEELGSNAAYNMPAVLEITGQLNLAALQQALSEIVRRHESLRTTFANEDGTPSQQVQSPRPVDLPVVDLQSLSGAHQQAEAQRLCEQEAMNPFHLQQDMMVRAQVLQLATEEFLLLLTLHHIASDGWSIGIFVKELATLYRAFSQGQPSPLSELVIQYADFALWQRDPVQGALLDQQVAYWQSQLAGAPALLQLPTDRPRPAQQSFRGAATMLTLDVKLTQRLRQLSQANGATLYMTLLTAFQILLARYSGQQDIVVGTPIANRHRQELEPLIGFFVNTLALRADLSDNPSFLALLAQVKATTQAAYDHQDLPFERLVEALAVERTLHHNPLVQVMFALQNAPMGSWELPGVQVKMTGTEVQSTRFDLEIHCWEVEEGLQVSAIYNRDLFEAATIQRLLGHFQTLLAGIVANPQATVTELPLLTAAERQQLLVDWNNTATTYPQAQCLHHLFEEQAARTPDAVAVVMAEEKVIKANEVTLSPGHPVTLTYAELNERANQLAHHLQSLGVGVDDRVGLCLERGPDMIVALLAILKAGAGYVPFDPTYPTERLAFMVENAQLRLLITTVDLHPQLAWAERVTCFTEWAQIAHYPTHNPVANATPETLLYCLYTSGSTGQPKGVVMPHRAITNLIRWQMDYTTVAPDARTLQYSPLNFDVSCQEIFATLCAGGTLVLVEEERRRDPHALLAYLAEQRVQRLYLPFVALQQLAEAAEGQMPASLQEVNTAGEQLQITPALAHWFRHSNCRLQNHYGPTETHVVTAFALPPSVEEWRPLPPIGRPIANTQIYILDAALQPTPIGIAGELYIAGLALADGYNQRPDLTHERFRVNPFGPGRVYKTGDLARWLPDGNIEYLGRIDQQVKIRGFRIELGEIEALLRQHPQVQEAVVVAQDDALGGKRLVAYVVHDATHDLSPATLRAYLQSKVPEYMTPTAFVAMHALPLTPSGKVDRKALPIPVIGEQTAAEMVPPQSELERMIATIWQEELKLANVGIQSNFFDLGGHSLLLTRVHHRLRKVLDYPLKMVDLFQYPTIQSLSRYITQASRQAADPAQQPPAKPPAATKRRRTESSEIAIIGMAGQFPGAPSVGAFWQNLCAGKEGISLFSREELTAAGVTPAELADANYVAAGGIVDQIEWFDAEFFGISPREAELLDPQQRLFLETVWHALEDAGYDPLSYPGEIALYAGAAVNSYIQYNLAGASATSPADFFQLALANDKDFLTTRTSYKLNLRGPSMLVQTACSTSLVAVHQACQSLRSGECDIALTGGVCLHSPQKRGYLYQPGMILSPDGHCRAFDAQAQGTVGGEGVAVVVLKPLHQAISDGDQIYAVIKGSAVNNDGSNKIGYTAPSVNGQAAVIAAAQADAGVEPTDISYIETHGTGTPLGDPIEIAALKEVFGARQQPGGAACALGAVKTNIGHLDTAAGVAALIKTALALKHQQLPPTLHFNRPNPQLGLEESPFYVNTALQPWPTTLAEQGRPRRAGVSSFGIGGSNAHVIVEEAPISPPATGGQNDHKGSRSHHLLTLSAKNGAALQELTQRYIAFLDDTASQPADATGPALADLCYTSHIGRAHFTHRLAVTAESKAAMRQKLLDQQSRQTAPSPIPSIAHGIIQSQNAVTTPRIAFLFTGQGSQYPEMGRQLYESQPIFRQTMDHCDEILRPLLGESILAILYPEAGEDKKTGRQGEKEKTKIDNTRYAQPTIFALEYALARLWQAWGIQPTFVMGHSVGELVAACVAGVFSLGDGLKLIAARARLMSELPETGEMMTVLADEARVQALLAQLGGTGDGVCDEVAIAALNGPQQVVLSGRTTALQTVIGRLTAEGIQSRKLSVSHAFHSPMMEPMLAAFAQVADTIIYHPPQIPLVSNLTGQVAEQEVTKANYWVRHVRQPVRFADGIATLSAEETAIFLEIGPKPTLLSLARQCLDKETGKQEPALFLPTLRQGRNDWQQVCESLGELYVRGVQISWAAVDRGFDTEPLPRRVNLPCYPFQRQRYWIEPSFKAHPPVPADPQSLLRGLVNQNNIDQITHLLIETGLLPKVLERLMTAYHPGVGGTQQAGQALPLPVFEQQGGALNQPQTAPHQATNQTTGQLAQQLTNMAVNAQHAHVTAWFQRTAAQLLGYAESQLLPQSIAGSLGMDSLMVIELRNRVEQAMGITLPVATLLTASFEQLATIAIEELATTSSPSNTAVTTETPSSIMATASVTAVATTQQRWVRCLQPNPQARLRLFCLPYAGSGAAIYRTWATALPATIELCALQLPGREDRLHEPAYRQWSALLTDLVEGIHPYLDKPFAIFGHSMGALLGYELACALRQQHNLQPSHLFVSAHRAPQIVGKSSYRSRWELLEDLYRQAGIDDNLRQESDLMTMSKEVFSADLDLSKSYRYQPGPPLTCPLTVVGGLDDALCSPEALDAWRDHTTGPFTVEWLPGNHFFIHHARVRLLALLAETMHAS